MDDSSPCQPPQDSPNTGAIRIETAFRTAELNNFAVPVEIRGSDLSVVAHTRSGQTVEGLEHGRSYVVTAQLPGGPTITQEVSIPLRSTSPIAVVLEPGAPQASTSHNNEVQQFFGNPAATILPRTEPVPRQEWRSDAAPMMEALGVGAEVDATGIDEEGAALDSLLGDYLGHQPKTSPTATAPPLERRVLAAPSHTSVFESANRPEISEFAESRDEVQIRLFHGNPLSLAAVAQDVGGIAVRTVSRSVRELSIPGSSEGLWYLQVLHSQNPAVVVALPISPSIGCTVTLSRVPAGSAVGQEMDAVSLDVHFANVEANAMARYRASGFASEASMGMEPDANGVGTDHLIGGTFQDPIAAAVGSYALLRFNRLDQLDASSEKLCNAIPWLPDGAVIRGEYLARVGRHAEALEVFLEVADRGLPLFNEGLGFTMERLDLYVRAHEPELTLDQIERVRSLLPLLQRYSVVTDFTKQLIRFHGLTPNTPGFELMSTLVSDPTDVTRLDMTFDGIAASSVETQAPADPHPPAPAAPTLDLQRRVIAATEARFTERAAQRAIIEAKLADAHSVRGSILGVDDPQRLALRTQRVLDQPIVREALGSDTAAETLETLGVVEGSEHLLERILAGNNLLGVAFLELGTTVARTVGLIHIRDQFRDLGRGTGFMVSPRLILTNNHVLPDSASARFSQVEFNFQNGLDGRPMPSHVFDLEPDVLFITDAELDFTVVAVSPLTHGVPHVSLACFGFNRTSRDQGKLILGESINVIQHPDGRPKQIALQQNELIDRLDNFLHYRSDTSPGSSGSPLYNNQWEVVGLHHSGVPARGGDGRILAVDGTPWSEDRGESTIQWVANEGARISSILERVGKVQGLTPEQQSLIGDFLNPPPVTALALPDDPPQRTSEPAPTPADGTAGAESTATDDSAATRTPPVTGSISLTIPVHLTVRLGEVRRQ
ncbi:trypsin-like serine peptidase [Rhodococcus sp. NPDC058521]|uniref:trypsin-like serine peptidase n=1 Tax=Rhodococcus sp. NPDC058521 TaxID=3346536 RepID=UPI003662FF2B